MFGNRKMQLLAIKNTIVSTNHITSLMSFPFDAITSRHQKNGYDKLEQEEKFNTVYDFIGAPQRQKDDMNAVLIDLPLVR